LAKTPKRSARAAAAIEERILAVGPENVAAFIGEPVQGAGGVIIPPPGYWQKVEAICRKYGILLVADEVICGFGRLGAWFGFQHFGFTPDIVSMAKGLSSGYLPISATAVSREIVETLRASGEEFTMAIPIRAIRSAPQSRCATSTSSSAKIWSAAPRATPAPTSPPPWPSASPLTRWWAKRARWA
jgi:4-aminobutyrate aminotransferase-like enzyme